MSLAGLTGFSYQEFAEVIQMKSRPLADGEKPKAGETEICVLYHIPQGVRTIVQGYGRSDDEPVAEAVEDLRKGRKTNAVRYERLAICTSELRNG